MSKIKMVLSKSLSPAKYLGVSDFSMLSLVKHERNGYLISDNGVLRL